MPTGFCILSACSELRDPCAEARWRFRLRFLRFPFFVVLKLDVRAKRGRRATRLFRRRGRTPLATACAAHFVRGICRYYTAIFHDGEAPSLREGRAPARPLPRCRFRSSGSSTLPRRPAVAEDCDPPATRGDGALAIVSACQLPRHHVLATGNGRDKRDPPVYRHDGEGSPLLRPLARLTSFGGYVATTNCQLPTINYQLSTILYQLHFYTSTRPFRRRGRRRYYTAISTARAPSLLHGHFSVTAGGTRSRASAFSSMRSLVRRPCGPVPGHQASSRCLRRAIEAASARFVAPSLAKMALTCSLTV